MNHPETTNEQHQQEPGTGQVIPLYVNRPLITDADIEHAEAQEQAA